MDEGFVLVLSLFLKYVRSAIRPHLHYRKSFWIHREFLLLVSNIVFRPKEDWSQNHHLAHNLVRHSLHSIHEPFVVISENMNHTYFFSNVADSFRTQFQWYWEISWIGLREYQRRSQRPIELATTDNYKCVVPYPDSSERMASIWSNMACSVSGIISPIVDLPTRKAYINDAWLSP